ncbi:MAG: FkbM family methyltransferase [Anaerolineales bacterium]|nr:FkbM family methyltransferase [Anaerolineales bacterium]
MANPLLSFAAFAARILPQPVKQAIYRLSPLARPMRDWLNRAAPTGLTTVKVAAGDLAGFILQLDLQTEKDYWLGTYEPELQATLRALVKPGMVAYDVGANIGYVTLLLARAVAETGRVCAFEALPSNVERLRANIGLNGMKARVMVVAGAVTAGQGPLRFLVHTSGGMGKAAGSAGRRADDYLSEITVTGISLDEFVYTQGNPPPQVIKMDIEGGEVMALPGMRRLLVEARPRMLLELHGPESTRLAWEMLTAAGYEICWMKRGFPPVASLEALGWKAYLVARPKA